MAQQKKHFFSIVNTAWICIILTVVFETAGFSGEPVEMFLRGDVNIDGKIDLADPISMLNYLFAEGEDLSCPDSADINDDGKLDLGDPIACLGYLYSGGTINPPFEECGPDPTPDTLPACTYNNPVCGPTKKELVEQTSTAFLDSYLEDPVGEIDPSFFFAEFNTDGFDTSQYLDDFWSADDAVRIEDPEVGNKQGVEVIYYIDENTVNYYNIFLQDVFVNQEDDSPSISQFGFAGGLWQNGSLFTYYESLSHFFLNPTQDSPMQITAPGPLWEFETLTNPPESFSFVIDEARINGETFYQGFPIPEFLLYRLDIEPGQDISFETTLSIFGSQDANSGPINLHCTAEIFLSDSPADLVYKVPGETDTSMDFEDVIWSDVNVFDGTLTIPADLQPGWYTLNITIENDTADGMFSYDGLIIPLVLENR